MPKQAKPEAKGAPIVETVVVFLLLLVLLWAVGATPPGRWQRDHLHWNFLGHLLFALVPLAILWRTGRDYARYGFTPANWKYSVQWGVVFAFVMAVPLLISLAFGWIAMLPVYDRPPLFRTILFQLFFVGFAGEILFRGYIQSRLNEQFGHRWTIAGFRCGYGLLIASLLFGIAQVLNPFNPFAGEFAISGWGFAMISAGLMFGLMREKTGTFLAPAVAHGSCVWCGYMAPGAGKFILIAMGWALGWILLFTFFAAAEPPEQPQAIRGHRKHKLTAREQYALYRRQRQHPS